MANPAESEVQNLLPVQAYFNTDGSFNTFIGQGQPFYATANPQQSGLNITNSTINSTTIGATTPSTGVFTNIATTTGTISTQAVGATDIVNLLALQSYAAGISWKQPCVCATLANITLSGLQTIDGHTVVAGDRVLVKNQSTAANNGIYLASASAWTRSLDANIWDELICAISFIEYGTQAGGAWFCTAQDGGTLGVTAVNWSQFTTSATYSAGTGLTLTGTTFSITPVGTASTYGSASTVPVFTTNASGQVSSVTNTNIAIGATQITSETIDSARLSGSYSGITGLGTLTDLTVTNAIVGSITGNAGTATTAGSATTATTATNLAGGATGSLPYQTASSTTGFLAAGTNGQILALASGVPSWIDNQTGTVTSVSGSGTVSGISLSGTVTSSGSLTLGGTLDLSAPPAIGGTLPNSITASTLTVNDTTTLGSSNSDTVNFNARINSEFTPATNNTYDLGRTGHEWRDLYITGTANIDSLVADTADINAGTIDNTVIGGTTPLAGTFTDLRVNNTISLAGSTGTSGYVMTSNGASAPTWSALPASGITITDDTTTNATRYLTFTDATSGSISGANVSSTKLSFNPSTGSLGIGTSSPAYKLDVSGQVRANAGSEASALIANSTNAGGTALNMQNSGTVNMLVGGYNSIVGSGNATDVMLSATQGVLAFGTGASSAERMRIDGSGNILVQGGYLRLKSAIGDSNGLSISEDGSGTAIINNGYSNVPITFQIAGSEKVRIDGSGNFLVGKTSQTNTGKLEIDYSRATHAGTSYNETSASSTCTHIAFQRDGTGVGSISSPNNSSTAYNTSSDYRLKENIAPMTGALGVVSQLKPVTYNWKVDGSSGQGFIAHELQAVVPDCVTGDKDATRIEQYEITPAIPVTYDEEANEFTPAVEAVMGEREVPSYQGIDTSFLVATLTAAIQEQQAIITEQANAITALEARLTALEIK